MESHRKPFTDLFFGFVSFPYSPKTPGELQLVTILVIQSQMMVLLKEGILDCPTVDPEMAAQREAMLLPPQFPLVGFVGFVVSISLDGIML